MFTECLQVWHKVDAQYLLLWFVYSVSILCWHTLEIVWVWVETTSIKRVTIFFFSVSPCICQLWLLHYSLLVCSSIMSVKTNVRILIEKFFVNGVPMWLSRLRVQCCHYSESGWCCGMDSSPGLETSICFDSSQKKKKSLLLKDASHHLSLQQVIYTYIYSCIYIFFF